MNEYKRNYLKNTLIEVVVLDDESIDLRNRLSIISINGTIGFIFILITLFIFLNKKSGLWGCCWYPFYDLFYVNHDIIDGIYD